jgi:hypothetical protein
MGRRNVECTNPGMRNDGIFLMHQGTQVNKIGGIFLENTVFTLFLYKPLRGMVEKRQWQNEKMERRG